MAAQVASNGAENLGAFYSNYKHNVVVNINGTNKAMSTPTDISYYVVQNFYDNAGQGSGQRTDLLQAIQMACGLYKGNI